MNGLAPEYSQPLDNEQSEAMLQLMFLDEEPEGMRAEVIEQDVVCAIVCKRIDVLDLPVKVSTKGLVYLSLICKGNPGRSVVTLIDILDTEIEDVTMDDIVNLYPWGHYNEDRLGVVIDEHKQRVHKWSHIY